MIEEREKRRLAAQLGERIRFDVPLAPFTSWQTGGPADLLYAPQGEDDLLAAAQTLCPHYPYYILGRGTNLLVADSGYRGAIFSFRDSFRFIRLEGESGGALRLRVGAGTPLADLYQYAFGNRLTGMEWAYGIPGSVGGALRMNAGTFLGQVQDVVAEVRGLDEQLNRLTWSKADLRFAYRRSGLPEKAFFTDALFTLAPGDPAQMRAKVAPLKERKARQPLDKPSAGSTFKNPPGQSAAALIEAAGCKGRSIGGAVVSTAHANFILNTGGATSADILALIREVRRAVEAHCGVLLELEVKLLGVEL